MSASEATPPETHLSLEPNDAGERIDRFLCRHVPTLGRKLSAQLCESGRVLLNGKRVRKSELLPASGVVVVRGEKWGHALPFPELEPKILLLRDDLLIADKPPGIPSGALIGKEGGTFAGALLARYPEIGEIGYNAREPGLLHRLDTFTSGLLLVARNSETFSGLLSALQAGELRKKYLALVPGNVLPDSGRRCSGLQPDPKERERVREWDGGKEHCTSFTIRERGERFDLVEVSVSAAYRHQIRAHLAALGAPLIGDVLYGSRAQEFAPRHALHASYIAGAAKGVPAFEARSGLPDDLAGRLLTSR